MPGDRHGSNQRGILAIWHNMVAEQEQALNDWYNHEHHQERVDIPGFHSAQRYVALEGSPRYFVFYETTEPSVLDSKAYLERVNSPSAWTQQSMPHYRDTNRLVCSREAFLGSGHGGCLMTLRFPGTEGGQGFDPVAALARAEPALKEPGIVSVQVWKTDQVRTDVPTREKEIRGKPDGSSDGVIVISGNRPDQVSIAAARHFDTIKLLRDGVAGSPPVVGLYQLVFSISK